MGAPTDGWAKSPRTRNADGTSAKDAAGGDRPGQGRKKAWASICRSDPQQVTPEAEDDAGGPLSGHATTARTDSDSGLRLRGTCRNPALAAAPMGRRAETTRTSYRDGYGDVLRTKWLSRPERP